ncbi:MAG: hypothetical protein OXC42_03420 [Gammaproteobacteria bacterium]|nr:hypothetical protein [Gammaproteobacteria bacterium]
MLIRPRLTDYHGIHIPQSELNFAIPFLNEDIPLYVDPFLMWKSPSLQDKALHQALLSAFNHLGHLVKVGEKDIAILQLIAASECNEVGFGSSMNRLGKKISLRLAQDIIALFEQIDYFRQNSFRHLEEIQLLVSGISKDRISDIACSFLKSFLIDYTYQECTDIGLPMQEVSLSDVYNHASYMFEHVTATLPVHPEHKFPILFTPKRWLRHVPWISYDAYFQQSCPQDDIAHKGEKLNRVKVLTYNRDNYDVVDSFIKERERKQHDCHNDPLFSQLPIISARRKLKTLLKLPTGKINKADKKYEKCIAELFASLFYPKLDFAQVQARTDSGVSIRDLIFYNSRTDEFLKEIMDDYGSRQITMEMKNVSNIERAHVDQINRYLHDELGRFGVLVTRRELKRAERQRVIDLWSGQRKAVISITDMDVKQMVEVFESKQRAPLDILKKKYVEFRRDCP